MDRDYDFYSLIWDKGFTSEGTITFKHSPEAKPFRKLKHDWYIIVALEKADKVKEDRHLLTRNLLLSYRWAIREGYQHQLDPALRRDYDYPRNRNTISGIKGYIEKMEKLANRSASAWPTTT